MAGLSLEEAKALVTPSSIDKLKDIVSPKITINTDMKTNNDILMSALCKAVKDGVILQDSLDEMIIKILNSPTNTLSSKKLGIILNTIHESQPKMCCVITLKSGDMSRTLQEWVFTGPKVYFNKIFEYVITEFKITPTIIRTKMTEMLKTTIVNNVAQLVAKYESLTNEEEKRELTISISTITRLVNMSGHLLFAEFKNIR